MRFPPALEAFDQHGGVSKLLYLLLPTTQVCVCHLSVWPCFIVGFGARSIVRNAMPPPPPTLLY